MADNVLIHDSADRVPPAPAGRHPLAAISGADFDQPRRRGLPPQAWILITAIVAGLLVWAVWNIDQAMRGLFLRYPWAADLLLWVLLAAGVVAIVGLLVGLAGRAHVAWAQARIVRTRLGVPVDIYAQLQANPLQAEALAQALEMARAPYAIHPNLSTLSQSAGNGQAAQLAEPIDVTPIPADQWLAWIDEVPHVMLAAETGAGKTTTGLHMLAPRLAAGESVFIIDPNAGGWGGVPSVGGGERWPIVAAALQAVIDEYTDRQTERAEYLADTGMELSPDHFPRLTVILDEAYITRLALDVGGRASVWRRFVPVLGSGARKVRISLFLFTQSSNVEDLGISGPLRENYTRLALDTSTINKLVNSHEPDKARRAAIAAAIVGQPYPAAVERHGQVVLLDRSAFGQPPALPSNLARLVWAPGMQAAERAEASAPTVDAIEQIKRAQAAGLTRDQARAAGLRFDNDLWAAVSASGRGLGAEIEA